MDISPIELSEQCQQLAEEIYTATKAVAGYEIAHKLAVTELKRAIGHTVFMLSGQATPSLIKLMAENSESVRAEQEAEQNAYALLIMGKAELEGLTAKFQAAKKCLDMKIEEMRATR